MRELWLALAGTGGLLAALSGLWVMGRSGWKLRRLLLGASLVLAGAMILLFVVDPDREIGGGRKLLLVQSPSLGLPEKRVLLKKLILDEEDLQVAWVTLQSGGAVEAARPAGERLRFLPVRDLGGDEGETREAVLPDDTLWSVVERLVSRVQERAGLAEGGLLFVHDDDPVWEHLRLDDGLGQTLSRLVDARVTSSVCAREIRLPSALELRLEAAEVPPLAPKELAYMVLVGLRHLEGSKAGNPVRLRVSIDEEPIDEERTAATGDCSGQLESVIGAGVDGPYARFPLGDLSCSQPLRPGFHRLAVEATLPSSDEKVPGGRGVHYFRVADPGLVVLAPAGKLAEVRTELLTALRKPGQRFRVERLASPAGPILFGELTDEGIRKAAARLASSRALLLVEPTWAQLKLLDAPPVRLGERIAGGLSAVVVRPPIRASPKELGWMPAWTYRPEPAQAPAAPAPGAPAPEGEKEPEGVVATREFRLYLLPDGSRLSQLPDPQNPAALPRLALQAQIIRGLYEKLGVEGRQVSLVQVRAGRLAVPAAPLTGDLGSQQTVTLFPPLTVRPDHSGLAARWELDDRWPLLGRRADVASASLSLRIPALYGQLGTPLRTGETGFEPLRRDGFYPNTAVVLFAPSLHTEPLPEMALGGAVELGGRAWTGWSFPETGRPAETPPPQTVGDLAVRGIAVFVVNLPVEGAYESFYKEEPEVGTLADRVAATSGSSLLLPAAYQEQLPEPRILDGRDPAAVVREVVGWLSSRAPGTLSLGEGGRAIDPRLRRKQGPGHEPPAGSRRAPQTHSVLAPATSPRELAHAFLADDSSTPAHREMPAAVSTAYGNGQVVVLAWSPFDPDVWNNDAGFASADGWGLQRTVDLVELTAAYARSSSGPVLREVRELADGATLLLDVWFPTPAGQSLVQPTLADRPLEWLPSTDPNRRTFQLRLGSEAKAGNSLTGFHPLVLDPRMDRAVPSCAPPGPGDECIFLRLQRMEQPGRNILEALETLAVYSGGNVVPFPRSEELQPGDREDQVWKLAARHTWASRIGIPLACAAILLLSPAVRPWAGAWLALARILRRRKQRRSSLGEAGRFNVDGVLSDWGQHPGAPAARRLAGTPSARKIYEQGDDLGAAEPVSLVPFTLLGRRLGLPPTRPRIRRRHATRSMEAILLVDASPSLRVPDVSSHATKLTLAQIVAEMLARSIWRQAGSVRVMTTRRPGVSWGPRQSEDDTEDLRRFLAGELTAPGARGGESLPLPPDLTPGHTVFLLSDLLTPSQADLLTFLRRATENDARLRVIHLRDPAEASLVGLGWDAASGLWLDRTHWAPAELETAYRAHRMELRNLVEKSGVRFVSLLSSQTGDEILQELLAAELLP